MLACLLWPPAPNVLRLDYRAGTGDAMQVTGRKSVPPLFPN